MENEAYLSPTQWKELLGNHVLILSKPNCPFCYKVKDLFTAIQQPFFEFNCQNLLKTAESKAFFLEQIHGLAKRSYTTFPMVFIGGEFIGGYTDVGVYLEKQNAFDETDF